MKLLKAEKPAAIFVEPQYPRESAEALAKETGVPIYRLDPVANGPKDAAPEYYITVMQKNLEALKLALEPYIDEQPS